MTISLEPKIIAVGPPRTGTSWLHAVLNGHINLPQDVKETRFFDQHYAKGFHWYSAYFDQSTSLPMGEICPTYFYSKAARENIHRNAPECRIVCTFRDPVARVFSLYKLKRAYAKFQWSFDEALHRDPELMESSRYVHHFSEWRRIFGNENVLPLFYEDLLHNTQSYIDQITEFAGIPPLRLDPGRLCRIHSSEKFVKPRNTFIAKWGLETAEWLKSRHWGKAVTMVKESRLGGLFLGGGEAIPRPLPATVLRLRRYFRREIDIFEKLVDRDLSAWKYSSDCLSPVQQFRTSIAVNAR